MKVSKNLYVLNFSRHWKAVLLGQAVSEEREWWSIKTVKTLCQRLLGDTHMALEQVCVCVSVHVCLNSWCNAQVKHSVFQISNLLRQCEQSVREQLTVATVLRQEERCILGSCLKGLEESRMSGHTELTPDRCSDLPVTTASWAISLITSECFGVSFCQMIAERIRAAWLPVPGS